MRDLRRSCQIGFIGTVTMLVCAGIVGCGKSAPSDVNGPSAKSQALTAQLQEARIAVARAESDAQFWKWAAVIGSFGALVLGTIIGLSQPESPQTG